MASGDTGTGNAAGAGRCRYDCRLCNGWSQSRTGAAAGREIYEIYLRPEFQGIGMGRKLFGESCRLLRSLGCKGLVVWCLEDSEHAVRFFRRHGGQDMVEGMEGFGEVNLRKLGFVWS